MFYSYFLHLFIVCMHVCMYVSVVYVIVCGCVSVCIHVCIIDVCYFVHAWVYVCACVCHVVYMVIQDNLQESILLFYHACFETQTQAQAAFKHFLPVSLFCCLFEADLMYFRLVLNSLFSSNDLESLIITTLSPHEDWNCGACTPCLICGVLEMEPQALCKPITKLSYSTSPRVSNRNARFWIIIIIIINYYIIF